eukprot:EG_transcript_12223
MPKITSKKWVPDAPYYCSKRARKVNFKNQLLKTGDSLSKTNHPSHHPLQNPARGCKLQFFSCIGLCDHPRSGVPGCGQGPVDECFARGRGVQTIADCFCRRD